MLTLNSYRLIVYHILHVKELSFPFDTWALIGVLGVNTEKGVQA